MEAKTQLDVEEYGGVDSDDERQVSVEVMTRREKKGELFYINAFICRLMTIIRIHLMVSNEKREREREGERERREEKRRGRERGRGRERWLQSLLLLPIV